MSTRALCKTMPGLMLLLLALAACQPPIVEVPVTVVVEQTRVVPVAVTPTQPTAPPGRGGSETRPYTAPHPILGDLRVRQGIAYCTNKIELINSVYPWLDDPALFEMDSFVRREHWAYPHDDPDLVRYPFDLEKGRALFEEAGWTLAEGATYRTNAAGEEMALKFTTTTAQFRQTWAAVFEEQMKACGLRILRFHVPAAWWFGDTTGLMRRDFELGAYAWVQQSDPGGRALYACDQIPSPENGWKGQNYMGWCNPRADEAIRTATASVDPQVRREVYRIVQEEFTKDLPSLPLFSRMDMMVAMNAALQNLAPRPGEWYYTWNAAQWVIPGRDTIVIGEDAEPPSLLILENAYFINVLRTLVTGVDYTNLNYEYQPVMLTQMPTIENGAAVNNIVEVREGESIVDADGNPVELKSGVRIRDAEGNEGEFTGGTAQMKQLMVKFEFIDGLTWSDGTPVSKADYELGYHITCDPETGVATYWEIPHPCDMIASVDFVSDTAYVVTWKPGYQNPLYFLPPFSRLPAHQTLDDGRKLAGVPTSEWWSLREVAETPLGVGPYVVQRWEHGKEMVLTANPFYYQGPPATPNIVVRFLWPTEQAIAALAAGEVDVLDAETITAEHAPQLLEAQAAGKVRVYLMPSSTWEHIDFALFVK